MSLVAPCRQGETTVCVCVCIFKCVIAFIRGFMEVGVFMKEIQVWVYGGTACVCGYLY